MPQLRKKVYDSHLCSVCGGTLQLSSGSGRLKNYKGQEGYQVPAHFKYPSCLQCGTDFLSPLHQSALLEHFEQQYRSRYFIFTTAGRLYQAPKEPYQTPKWWLFLSCEHDLLDYYRWHCQRYGLNVLKSCRSGPHVSIARGEVPRNCYSTWKDLLGQNITFKYSNQIRYNDEHIWLDVEPDAINQLRDKLGLRLHKSYHVTIGRFRDKV